MGVPGDRTQLSKNDGVVAYSTIIAISESPVLPGVVWAGTDDGNLQVSKDGGGDIHGGREEPPGLPPNHAYWISRIEASHFDPGTAYVSVDGHRDDDLKPYVFVTRDYGQTLASPSPATCRRSGTSRSCARIRRTATCSTPAPSSGCSSRWTAAGSGRSS